MEAAAAGQPVTVPQEYVTSMFCERMGCTPVQMREEWSVYEIRVTLDRWEIQAEAEANANRG
jgi:hypothetical protein